MSRTAISRFSPISSARRLLLLVGLIAVAFAMASIGHVSGASAQAVGGSGGDEGIVIDCPLGGDFVDPGNMISLPAAGDLPPVTFICGNDGQWHKIAAIVKSGSIKTVASPIVGSSIQLKK